MTRKVPVTISLESQQLDDLDDIVARTRINRSELIREGVDWIVKRYLYRRTTSKQKSSSTEPAPE